ncbi:NAD(P)-dependent oxidoreductase [Candidatus Woesearchaeota archaeon]|nr:NAD(P)-dependent oxidoreductase [Candidatus Woesearchaeota archaeon]
MKSIGFIGLGTMGNGMAQNLLKNGFKVAGYNRTKSKARKINHKNFSIANSPKEACKNSDIIITCVANDSALNEVLFSADGAFDALGKDKILVDCSTTSVGMTDKIAKKCGKKGIKFLDVPMTGSKMAAEAGTLLFMAGGDENVMKECMPVFNAMGKKVVYCGPNTYGQRAKIALNLTQALMLQSCFEGLVLGVKNGVPLASMIEIFENSGAKSGVGSVKIPKVLNRDFSPHFKLELMNKDVEFAMNEMQKLGLELPLSTAVAKVFRNAMAKGLGQQDFAGIAKLLEEEAGIEMKG